MEGQDKIIELLERIEANQRAALATQERHVQLSRDQLERSNGAVQESMALQRMAAARQARVTRTLVPLVFVLVVLLVLLVLRWHLI